MNESPMHTSTCPVSVSCSITCPVRSRRPRCSTSAMDWPIEPAPDLCVSFRTGSWEGNSKSTAGRVRAACVRQRRNLAGESRRDPGSVSVPCSVLDVARLQPDSPTHPLADETHNSDRPSLCTFPLSADNCSDPAGACEQHYQGHYSMQRAVLRACRSAAARSANVPRARHFSRTVSSLTHTAAVSPVPSRYACPQQNVHTPLVPCLTMPQEIDTDSCESPDRFWTASKLCQQDGQGPDHGGIALRGHPETVDQTGG